MIKYIVHDENATHIITYMINTVIRFALNYEL